MGLVLTRKPSESITIETPQGDVVTIEVSKVKGHRAHLNIEAPNWFKILRTELRKEPTND